MKTSKFILALILLAVVFLTSCKTQKYGCYEFSDRPQSHEESNAHC